MKRLQRAGRRRMLLGMRLGTLHIGIGSLLAALLLAIAPARADTLAIVGGRVFDGQKFTPRDLFVQDGVFVAQRPAKVDQTIDAAGLYLLPPFAEGHTHSFFGGSQSKGTNQAFLRAGVFYALCANNPTEVSREFRGFSDEELGGTRVDVLFANGGITAPGGHPVELYRVIHSRFMQQPPETFMQVSDDNAFYQVADVAALEQKLARLLATEPDLVKLYLLGHEKGGQKFIIAGQEATYIGLTAEVFREAVKRVHAAGKRCIVHVETVADVELTLESGADALAHLPYGMQGDDVLADKAISPELAGRIAERGMAVIATSGLGLSMLTAQKDAQQQEAARAVWEGNLRVLNEAGAKVLVGSDQFTPINEANALEKSGAFSRGQILEMWVTATPRWMFPQRKLGALEEGFDASVIGLAADPLEDWTAIQQVKLAVKQGKLLTGKAVEPGAELMD